MVFEVRHSMNESPTVACPHCNSRKTSKVPPLVGISVRSGRTLTENRALDQVRRNAAMQAELQHDFGIEKIKPLRKSTMADVYHDVKSQASVVRESMAASAEQRASETKKKQREWMKGALQRTPGRAKEIKARKAADAAKKRSIRL
jgi:predicted nucleic acid-binding Zn ribbon protein